MGQSNCLDQVINVDDIPFYFAAHAKRLDCIT